MADLIRFNASDFLARVRNIKRNIFKVGGEELSKALTAEYETLVKETPQWSGATAASWSMGFYAPTVDASDKFKKPKTRAEALKKGMAPAIGESLARVNLSNYLKDYLTKDVTITNGCENFDYAEGGPLREENEPGGMYSRFLNRIRNLHIVIDGSKLDK